MAPPCGDERERAAHRPAREQLLDVRSEDHDDSVIITARGEVDGFTTSRLSKAIDHAFTRLDGRTLVVDLTGVRFLGSPGLRTLLDSAAKAAGHPGVKPLRIVVDHTRPVIRPIEVSGLDHVLALYRSVDDALIG